MGKNETTYSHGFSRFFHFPHFSHVSPFPFPFGRPSSTVSAVSACATKKAIKAQHAAASQEGCEARLCKIATFMVWFQGDEGGAEVEKMLVLALFYHGCFTMVNSKPISWDGYGAAIPLQF